MPIARDARWERLRRVVERFDLFYVVPVMIAVAAFIVAVMGYFANIR